MTAASSSLSSMPPPTVTLRRGNLCIEGKGRGRSSSWKLNAFPDWPLMAVMVEHVANQRDYVVHKSIWHLGDETMKNIYTMHNMFTCWGCCFFGSTKDPFYDGDGDGGDETVHWVYEKVLDSKFQIDWTKFEI